MTVREKLVAMLVSKGMFENHAKKVIELAIPKLNAALDEAEGIEVKEGEEPAGRYRLTWDSPSEDYETSVYLAWSILIAPVALKWLDENKPNAWNREMFF